MVEREIASDRRMYLGSAVRPHALWLADGAVTRARANSLTNAACGHSHPR